MTINRNDLNKLPITINPWNNELLDAVTKKGTGQDKSKCFKIISADKNNLFVADNKIIGRCDSKGENYSECTKCVYALNKSIDMEYDAFGDHSFM